MRLNPTDALARGIGDGTTVRLSNSRGACLATAQFSDNVRAGVAVLPTGSWFKPATATEGALETAGNPNVLTLDIATSRFGQGCSAHTCLIRIEAVD